MPRRGSSLVVIAAAAGLLAGPAIAQSPSAARDIAELDMSAVPKVDANVIKTIQTRLRDRGINPGPIDGIVGPKTEAAIRTFRESYGLKSEVEVDNQLLFALGEAQLAAELNQ